MKTSWMRLLLIVAAALPARGFAANSMKDAVSALPGDTICFVCVPDPKQLDADFGAAVKMLGLDAMIQPPFNQPTSIVKTFLQMGDTFDDTGSMCLVILNAANPMEFNQKTAFIFPAKDPKGMLTAMGGTAADDGSWGVALFGQPSFAATKDKHVVIAQSADVAKQIAKPSETLGGKLNATDVEALDGLDIALWIDGDRLLKAIKPQVDMVMAMATMQQASAGPVGAKQAEMTKKQVDMFFEGAASLSLGFGLGEPGLTMRVNFRTKPGSELAKSTATKNTSEPLLRGLPADNYLFAFGSITDPSVAKESVKSMEGYFAMAEALEGVDKEQVTKLRGLAEQWVPMMTGMRGAVVALPPGPDGLFAVNVIVDAESSDKWIDLMGQAIETGKKLVASASPEADADVKKMLDAITWAESKEELAGAKVRELKFDIAKAGDLDEEEVQDMQKVIGKEGATVRVSRVDDKTVTISFGGGAKNAGALIEQVKGKSTALEADAGIKKVAAHMPKERAGVGYFAVDRILEFVGTVMKTVEEDEFPVKMPKLNAPLAMTSSSGKESIRVDFFVPSELMVAGKNAIMTAMGQGAPPPGDGKAGGAEAKPSDKG